MPLGAILGSALAWIIVPRADEAFGGGDGTSVAVRHWGWRTLYLTMGGIGVLCSTMLCIWLPESVRFLIDQEREKGQKHGATLDGAFTGESAQGHSAAVQRRSACR